jgi:hypothetical protein
VETLAREIAGSDADAEIQDLSATVAQLAERSQNAQSSQRRAHLSEQIRDHAPATGAKGGLTSNQYSVMFLSSLMRCRERSKA